MGALVAGGLEVPAVRLGAQAAADGLLPARVAGPVLIEHALATRRVRVGAGEPPQGGAREQLEGELVPMLLRLDPEQDESVIRMWGIEHQVQRARTSAGAENRAILDLTRAINDVSRGEK